MPNLGQDKNHWYGGNLVAKMTDKDLIAAMVYMLEVLLIRFPSYKAIKREIECRNLMSRVVSELELKMNPPEQAPRQSAQVKDNNNFITRRSA